MRTFITLLLIGLSIGLDNFGASVGIGLSSGLSREQRIRIAAVFGLFETGMPLLGLLLGQGVASHLGGHANIIGGSLLVLTGLYFFISTLLHHEEIKPLKAAPQGAKLLLSGLSISIDNLIVGFSLGTRHVPLLAAVLVIGICSVSLSLLGLELGNRVGQKLGAYGEQIGGVVLILVGIAIATKVL